MNMDRTATPGHLWAVGVISLLWNAGGVMSYLMTELNMLDMMEMPAEQLDYFRNFPAWATAFWALGVWGCFVGSVLLLLRHRLAVMAFGISIIGLVGTTYYQQIASDLPESMQTPGQMVFAAAIWVITIGLFLYARAMRTRGVLR